MGWEADNFVSKLVRQVKLPVMGGDHGRMASADWNVTAKSGLSCYLWKIQRFPMMEPHEEYVLAKRWREHGDHKAAHKLVNSHLRLVAKVARGYRGYGLPISDLISEGNVGLIGAIQRFESEKGFRLAAYAVWWSKYPPAEPGALRYEPLKAASGSLRGPDR
jgi:DNA-directed RNA polymerase sigma subunit (sigma70/sigma32)